MYQKDKRKGPDLGPKSFVFNGAGNEARTRDPQLGNASLGLSVSQANTVTRVNTVFYAKGRNGRSGRKCPKIREYVSNLSVDGSFSD